MRIARLIFFLFILMLSSSCTNQDLQIENEQLKSEIDSLKQVIEKTESYFHFKQIESRVSQQEEKFIIGKEGNLDLIISSKQMFDINGNQYKVTYSAKSSNGNDFRILNNENLIKYKPKYLGLDTLFIDFIFCSIDSSDYFKLPSWYVIEVEK